MMSGIISRLTTTSALISLLALYGCGSDGDSGPGATSYTGSNAQAVITDTNANELSTTATEASNEAVDGNEINPFAISITNRTNNYVVTATNAARSISNNIQSNNTNLPTGLVLGAADLSAFLPGFCGGSVTVSDNFGQDGTLNGRMTFNSICINDGVVQITMNGIIQFTDSGTSFSIQFINFSVSDGVTTETLNATLTCDSSFISCSLSAVYVGADGKTYKIENLTVTENFNTVDISGRFFHPDHGYVDLTTTTSISYNCPTDGRPDTGTLELVGSNGTITVMFNGCTSYSVTFNGITTPHTW